MLVHGQLLFHCAVVMTVFEVVIELWVFEHGRLGALGKFPRPLSPEILPAHKASEIIWRAIQDGIIQRFLSCLLIGFLIRWPILFRGRCLRFGIVLGLVIPLPALRLIALGAEMAAETGMANMSMAGNIHPTAALRLPAGSLGVANGYHTSEPSLISAACCRP